MFKTTYKSGLISIFSSCGSNPLQLWQVEVKNGHVKRMTDGEICSFVLEIVGCNVSATYIIAPKGTKGLGISLPYMVMLVKNLKKPFTFEVTVIDDGGFRRRIRVSTFQSKTQIQPMSASMPIVLHAGWNEIKVNLAEYTYRSFHTQFKEVVNVKVNANIRLRRIYFTETLLSEDELPHDYRLYKPTPTVMKKAEAKENNKENKQQQAVDRTANGKKGSKVNVKLEPKTVIPKIEKVEATPAEAASTEGDDKVKPQAADEQEVYSKRDATIGEAADEQEVSSKGDATIGEAADEQEVSSKGDATIGEAADEQEVSSKGDATIGEAADEQEVSSKGDAAIGEAALQSEAPVTEEEIVTEGRKNSVAVDTALNSELTEPATIDLPEPAN